MRLPWPSPLKKVTYGTRTGDTQPLHRRAMGTVRGQRAGRRGRYRAPREGESYGHAVELPDPCSCFSRSRHLLTVLLEARETRGHGERNRNTASRASFQRNQGKGCPPAFFTWCPFSVTDTSLPGDKLCRPLPEVVGSQGNRGPPPI